MKELLSQRQKRVLLSGLVAGLVIHGFRFANKLYSMDSYNFIDTLSRSWNVSLGRYTLPVIELFRGPRELTWLIGVMSVAWLCLAALLIVELYDLKSHTAQVLTAVILVGNPVVTGTFVCLYTADIYFLAAMLSVLSACFLIRLRGWRGSVLAGLCLVLAISVYQAYISVIFLLLIFHMLKMLMDPKLPMRSFWKECGRYALTGLLSCGVYLLGIPYFRNKYGIDSTGFNELTNGWGDGSEAKAGLLRGLCNSYIEFARYLLTRWEISFYNVSNVLMLLGCGLLLFYICKKRGLFRKSLRPVWIVLLLLLFPIASHPFCFVSVRNVYMSTPASFSMCLLYVLPLILFEEAGLSGESIALWRGAGYVRAHVPWVLQTLLLFLICFNFFVLANKVYETMAHGNDQMEKLLLRLENRMEMQPEYRDDMQLAIYGNLVERPDQYVDNAPMIGGVAYGFYMEGQRDYIQALNWHMGSSYRGASDARKKELARSGEFAEMQPWPSGNCVRVIDGTMVLYMSERGLRDIVAE